MPLTKQDAISDCGRNIGRPRNTSMALLPCEEREERERERERR